MRERSFNSATHPGPPLLRTCARFVSQAEGRSELCYGKSIYFRLEHRSDFLKLRTLQPATTLRGLWPPGLAGHFFGVRRARHSACSWRGDDSGGRPLDGKVPCEYVVLNAYPSSPELKGKHKDIHRVEGPFVRMLLCQHSICLGSSLRHLRCPTSWARGARKPKLWKIRSDSPVLDTPIPHLQVHSTCFQKGSADYRYSIGC